MWPDTGSDIKWGDQPCVTCDTVYDQNGQCDCTPAKPPAVKKKQKKTSAGPRGFKGLKNVTIGAVSSETPNKVMILDKDKASYFVIEAKLDKNGKPTLVCKRHKVVKYKLPVTRSSKFALTAPLRSST